MKPKTNQYNIRLRLDMKKAAEEVAAEQGSTLSEWIRREIMRGIVEARPDLSGTDMHEIPRGHPRKAEDTAQPQYDPDSLEEILWT